MIFLLDSLGYGSECVPDSTGPHRLQGEHTEDPPSLPLHCWLNTHSNNGDKLSLLLTLFWSDADITDHQDIKKISESFLLCKYTVMSILDYLNTYDNTPTLPTSASAFIVLELFRCKSAECRTVFEIEPFKHKKPCLVYYKTQSSSLVLSRLVGHIFGISFSHNLITCQ